jgi:hypothetical protein
MQPCDLHDKGQSTTIYELLEVIRERPTMYLEVKELSSLASFINGVLMALLTYRIHLAEESPSFQDFVFFVAEKFNERRAISWRRIILEATNEEEEKAYHLFFELLDEYRQRGVEVRRHSGLPSRPFGPPATDRRRLLDVFNLLDDIRARPTMYLPAKSITSLRKFVSDFLECATKLEHAFELRANQFRRFDAYVVDRLGDGRTTELPDRLILATVDDDEQAAFDRYFELLDDFRMDFLIGPRIEA